MEYFISSLVAIALVFLLVFISKEQRSFNDLKKHHARKWEEDGINWYEESGSIDPETLTNLKIKNKVVK